MRGGGSCRGAGAPRQTAQGGAGPAWPRATQPASSSGAPGTVSPEDAACEPKAETSPGFRLCLRSPRTGQGLQTKVPARGGTWASPQHHPRRPGRPAHGALLSHGLAVTSGPRADLRALGLAQQALNPRSRPRRPQPWTNACPEVGAVGKFEGLQGWWGPRPGARGHHGHSGGAPPPPRSSPRGQRGMWAWSCQIFRFFKRSQKSGPLCELCQLLNVDNQFRKHV